MLLNSFMLHCEIHNIIPNKFVGNPKKRMCKQLAAWRRWYLKMKKIWILCIQQNILAKFLRGKLAFKNTKILWPRCKKMPFLKAALDKKKKEEKKLNKTWKYSVTFSVFKLSTVLFNKSLECIIDVELKGMYFLPVVDRIEIFSIFVSGKSPYFQIFWSVKKKFKVFVSKNVSEFS